MVRQVDEPKESNKDTVSKASRSDDVPVVEKRADIPPEGGRSSARNRHSQCDDELKSPAPSRHAEHRSKNRSSSSDRHHQRLRRSHRSISKHRDRQRSFSSTASLFRHRKQEYIDTHKDAANTGRYLYRTRQHSHRYDSYSESYDRNRKDSHGRSAYRQYSSRVDSGKRYGAKPKRHHTPDGICMQKVRKKRSRGVSAHSDSDRSQDRKCDDWKRDDQKTTRKGSRHRGSNSETSRRRRDNLGHRGDCQRLHRY